MNRKASQVERADFATVEVRQIYAELAQRPIERRCLRRTECCHFKLTGLTPYLTKGEALVAARALRASGRKGLPESPEGTCPMLDRASGNCLIYADGPLARREVLDFIRRLEVIDAQLGGDGPRKLPAAIKAALGEYF